ncbi:glycosyltransferase 87 family protein [Frigoribacterium sp. CFBP 13712]|uniref:glycosyltransferase 87 family protein n=1 Tax=Frigoribacterium sp. CFBP 13712 TaxID=2775309 RepID=UPI00352FC1BF
MRTLFAAVAVGGLAVAVGWGLLTLGFVAKETRDDFVYWTTICWLLFAVALVLLRRVPARAVTALVLIGAAVVGGASLLSPPNTSTDPARYAWDGIVQADGVSPYEYTPEAGELRDLRPEWIFPPAAEFTRDDGTIGLRCGQETRQIHRGYDTETGDVVCTAINRPDVPTIYPPTAELYFWAVRAVVGPDAEFAPLQVLGLVMVLATTAALLVALRRRGLDPRWAALWGWCPLVYSEGVTNSHVDLLGGVLVLAASLLVSTRRRWRGGIALGAAIATKLIPVIAAPALLRRQPHKVIVGAVLTFAVLYVPYVVSTGLAVLGYLPGYLTEEGYEDGSRFALVSAWVPDAWATPVVALVVGVTGLLVWLKTDPDDPWLGQLVMIGVTLVAVSPRYPWYALLLVPFVAMTGRWEWLAIPVALLVRQFEPGLALQRSSLATAVLVILLVSLWRARPGFADRLLDGLADDALRVRRLLPGRGSRRRGLTSTDDRLTRTAHDARSGS